ncbi:cytochrome P450 [Aspergillus avenaceus]|uniref:Cytochrome P450 n=1 Tax=Aspergillus avenaceus TaxID=36643 RepID=A0A5N6U4Z7_ASPAV|nr:cytochrome P450 [Aspergillus avenaceus]
MLSGIALAVVFSLGYVATTAAWNLFRHPLHYIPGPRLWIAFPLLRYLSEARGRIDADLRQFHLRYGEAVRFAPGEVSFITAQAWKDINGHGRKQMPKARHTGGEPTDIIGANDADHTRFRKSLSHAFSAKGLQAQEPILMGYVDQLIAGLREESQSEDPVDMVKWYNLTTFDLIGDLAFGESFGGLKAREYHPWVATVFRSVQVLGLLKLQDSYPLLFHVLSWFIPKSLIDARRRQLEYSQETVEKRLRRGRDRGPADFMDSMLRHHGGRDGLTEEELGANASILVTAGSETTASLLSGVTFWLLQSPEVLAQVTQEVRTAMQSETDITFESVTTRLPFLLACIEEGFRTYPPVPSGFQRVTQTATCISGYSVPSGTKVAVHQSSAYRSPLNFHHADRFIPERWLPEARENPDSPFYHDRRDVLQPFSIGPRNCIGRNLAHNEMRLILARVLWNFDLALCQESRGWADQRSFIIWQKPPLLCRLTARAL